MARIANTTKGEAKPQTGRQTYAANVTRTAKAAGSRHRMRRVSSFFQGTGRMRWNLDAGGAIQVGQHRRAGAFDGQVLLLNDVVRQKDRSADGGTKLADVSRPMVRKQEVHCRLSKTPHLFLQLEIGEVYEPLGQIQDVFPALSQRWDPDR